MECRECGFGSAGCISTCTRLEKSAKKVEWKLFKDVERMGRWQGHRPSKTQTVPTKGRLCDLWTEFKAHSKLYMAHHAVATWQRNCHVCCLASFRDGDTVVETDFPRSPPTSRGLT